MKKILTVSLMAVMAVSAARAEIASTAYVDEKTGDLATLSTDNKTNLTAAVNELAEGLGTLTGDETGSVTQAITNKIEALDKPDTAVAKQFVTAVSEDNGVVSVSRRELEATDIPDISTTYQTKSNIYVYNSDTITEAKASDELYPSMKAVDTMLAGEVKTLTDGLNAINDEKTGIQATLEGELNKVYDEITDSVDGVAKGTDATIANDGVYVLTATVKEGKVESYYWELIDRGVPSSAN